MDFQIYDTLSRTRVVLSTETYRVDPLNIYVCGPTVYNLIHIGNARTFFFFDCFVRFCRAVDMQVNYVRNITDIDDKIIKKASEENGDCQKVSETYLQAFEDDMAHLSEFMPDISPKATNHISQMISLISTLIDRGIAYSLRDGVYYDISKFPDYGKLSRKKQEDLLSGVRIDLNDQKRNPGDFVLWKFEKPGEPAWEADFGNGRPGWHIECSVMADLHAEGDLHIHGGGVDLIHPHHENEIAQSEVVKSPFSRYWMHVAFLNIGKEKMSKSKANFILLRTLLEWFHPEVIRFMLLSGHYRSPLSFNQQILIEKHHALCRFYTYKKQVQSFVDQSGGLVNIPADQNSLLQILAEDMNTPKVIGGIFDTLKRAAKEVASNKANEATLKQLSAVYAVSKVLGLFGSMPQDFFDASEQKMLSKLKVSKVFIEGKILERLKARQSKDYKTSDMIRDELQSHGVVIQDLENEQVSWCLSPQLD